MAPLLISTGAASGGQATAMATALAVEVLQ